MRLIVTGGAGFIGSNFIRMWLGRHPGDEVVNLDLLTYAGDPGTLSDVAAASGQRYRLIQGDIADDTLVTQLVGSVRPDAIVNFAAESHNSRAVLEPAKFVRTNVVGTQVLLESVRRFGIERFHHISTCEVYGELGLDSHHRFTETSPYRPRTPYNASKAAADHLVRAYNLTYGVPVTISNCSNNYGPWQHPEKVIPLFTTNAIDSLPLPLYRQSHNQREWLHVEDHCRAIEMIIVHGRIGETYNVGSHEERSIEQVADAVLAALDRPTTLKTYVPDRPGHDVRYVLDHQKISAELGWEPRVRFDDGLAATISWYKEHEEWWRPKRGLRIDETKWASTQRSVGQLAQADDPS